MKETHLCSIKDNQTSFSTVSIMLADTCQTDGLSHGGGAATTADELSSGCHNGCPTTEPQVHVVVQTSSDQLYGHGQGSQVLY